MTTPAPIPEEVFFYGKDQPLPEQRLLKAGPLSVTYENGTIRYIRLEGFEVIRMIYPAVRDQNWGTVNPSMEKESIMDRGDSFLITYDAEYKEGEIHFVSRYRIEGTQSGEINFEMEGRALSSFKKNRIGFCVLHPVKECVGKSCEITEGNGKKIRGIFPEQISPHQPFKNIQSMRWQLPDGNYAKMEFDGDIFEMEDQRNWTDASYKTYSTPLEIPFPVRISAGTTINQAVKLTLEGIIDATTAKEKDNLAFFDFSMAPGLPLPFIGTGKSSEISELSKKDIATLGKIGFHHYRIDVRLMEAEWLNDFRIAVREANQLKMRLEIALHLPKERFEAPLQEFIQECTLAGAAIHAIILFHEKEKTTPVALLEPVFKTLRDAFPSVKIGGGTDAYFTELNRNRPPVALMDFLNFSINPQVHAFDNASLTETLEAQAFVVQSAQNISSGKPVHVSPVTLKPRFNPNATGPEPGPLPGHLPGQTDVRQMSLYGAGWTLGSVKYLSEAGADSITYYETVGMRGLLMGESSNNHFSQFPAPYTIFPVYALFKDILEYSEAEVLKSKSNKPLHFDGIVLRKGQSLRIILANFLNKEMVVKIPAVEGRISFRKLNSAILRNENWLNDPYFNSSKPETINKNNFSIILQPFGLATIDVVANT